MPLRRLVQVNDFIRMLDAEGYPHAFIETPRLRFEFTRAQLQNVWDDRRDYHLAEAALIQLEYECDAKTAEKQDLPYARWKHLIRDWDVSHPGPVSLLTSPHPTTSDDKICATENARTIAGSRRYVAATYHSTTQ